MPRRASPSRSRTDPPRPQAAPRDTSIATYRARRDFSVTAEPAPSLASAPADAPIFVVQKHDATRLHYDFRLEHAGVLWSWAVPKGPSLDPHDKRLAVRTEDHPLGYAGFSGEIPKGQYGAGTVEIWDRGNWEPANGPPAQALAAGELKFHLQGDRLHGGFVLVRLKPRAKERAENWLLIKEHDAAERAGADVAAMETTSARRLPHGNLETHTARTSQSSPIAGAVKSKLPSRLSPQLATAVDEPPQDDAGWLSEVKFDGYRLLAFRDADGVRLVTRNGHDWTNRLPAIAQAVAALPPASFLLDGELVALREDGVSSFALLQDALSSRHDERLNYYVFDMLHLDGWDLRDARLSDRKAALAAHLRGTGIVRYSDHQDGRTADMRREACRLHLEGIVVKRADARHRPGRGRDWLKVKCTGREELVVVGWTPPAGSRKGIGALQLGYRDEDGHWNYAGGVGSGFTDAELVALRARLDALTVDEPPEDMQASGDPIDGAIRWVTPELVAEIQFTAWSGAGRVRHGVYLGLREDKAAADVVRPIADPEAARRPLTVKPGPRTVRAEAPRSRSASPRTDTVAMGSVAITHADRDIWPGVTKRDLAEYWLAVADHALPEIAGRPLALVRCPEGIDGAHFFQKHAGRGFPAQIREGAADGAPYLMLDDTAGLLACAQMSAVELHVWGARLPDAAHPDRIVLDLDPGDGVTFAQVIDAAHDVRGRVEAAGLAAFCRSTGGKGLHVVVPLAPRADWDETRAWCRGFAETMGAERPDLYLSRLSKAERKGRILVDWLRNGLGSTAVASFSPRARPGAPVAARLSWREITPKLDPAAFTIAAMPKRLARLRVDPWADFEREARPLPAGAPRKGAARRGRAG